MADNFINSEALLQLARDLIVLRPKTAIHAYEDVALQTALRRSVSASYYSVFTHVQKAGADILVGADTAGTPAYVTVFRSFQHFEMRDACRALASGPQKPKPYFPTPPPVDPEIKAFAQLFVDMQEWRNGVDYDPLFKASYNTAYSQVARAEQAIRHFQAISAFERLGLVIKLLFKKRRD